VLTRIVARLSGAVALLLAVDRIARVAVALTDAPCSFFP
jgi:hypothetical protein